MPVTQASPFLSSLFTGAAADPAQNPVLQSQIDALTQASQQAFAPQLDEAAALFAGAGASGGSAEANARARMALGATQNLNQAIASLLFGTQQATQQQALQGIPLALALQQDPISRLQTSLGLSGAERTLAQAQQDVGLENALRQVELRQIPFRLAVSALQGVPLAMPQFGPSPLQENLALGTSLAKLAGGTALAASGNPAGFALLGQPAPAQAPKAT
ncbi:MAG: hypothetical protein GTO63_35135 [Anaerolineae bacterium]|nr:hypothetical protein [Anaerolineae bacterium]NIN99932.1 hypothetical protein [Anaerolineae bacterium]